MSTVLTTVLKHYFIFEGYPCNWPMALAIRSLVLWGKNPYMLNEHLYHNKDVDILVFIFLFIRSLCNIVIVPFCPWIANRFCRRWLWRHTAQQIRSTTLLGKLHISAVGLLYPAALRLLLRWQVCLVAEAGNLRKWRWYYGFCILLPRRCMIEPAWQQGTFVQNIVSINSLNF